MMDKIKKYLPLGAAAAGVLAVILFLACPGVVAEAYGAKVEYSGWETAFGKKMDYGKIKGAFWCILTVLLLIGAIASSVLAYVTGNKMFSLIAAACFFVAVVFLFSTEGFFLTANDAKRAADMYKLGAGSILGAILSILGLGAAAAPVVLEKLGK